LKFFSINAQVHFAEGFIVTNEGDTLHGFIEQREIDVNPSAFKEKQATQWLYADAVRLSAFPPSLLFRIRN